MNRLQVHTKDEFHKHDMSKSSHTQYTPSDSIFTKSKKQVKVSWRAQRDVCLSREAIKKARK